MEHSSLDVQTRNDDDSDHVNNNYSPKCKESRLS